MVDNFAEKFDECLLNQGHLVLFTYNWDSENGGIHISGVSAIQGLLK